MYNHKEIEKKWQDFWEKNHTFRTETETTKPKYYCLDMFPYPSGAGLHVGHPKGYTANDIIARYKKAKGFNVLHPMGWDAFGLPAENYAMKTGTHPRVTTEKNINTFKKQIQSLGFSYDWEREINTTDPKYFKWTQWIFLKMFEHGLAYEQDLPINYCVSCKTGLANEEVIDGRCERCNDEVEKRQIRQWVLAITKYADRLEKDVDTLDWPKGIKDMQKNWIGKSTGCEFEMKKHEPHPNPLLEEREKTNSPSPGGEGARGGGHSISVYTTRIDTVFGVTYAVIAPDHKDVSDFITEEQRQVCEDYITECKNKSDQDRTNEGKEKTGVFTGSYVVNPFNNEQIPLWIGDYVLGNYGTGAVMAVPAHDERDFEFAKKYGLEIITSVATKNIDFKVNEKTTDNTIVVNDEIYFIPEDRFKANTEYGILVNSGDFNNLSSEEAKVKLVEYAETKGFGKKKVNYKLRDWLFSRQRYWGEPIPLIHLDKEEVRGLPRISQEELSELQKKVEKIVNKKMKQVPLEELESGIHDDTSTSTSFSYSIINSIKKVKRKKSKNFQLKNVFEEVTLGKKKIRISGQYLKEHFKQKKGYDKIHRIKFAQTIITHIKDVTFISENVGLINIHNHYYCVIIDKINDNIYNLITFYHFHSLNKLLNTHKAYVLKEESNESSDERTLCSKGKVKSLVINGKVVSKIYSGLYTDIVCDYTLPLKLPEIEDLEPAANGNSPLAKVDNFVNVQLANNLKGKRETNTMPQWGGSCWYHLRYMDNDNDQHIVDKNISDYWGSVDSYVGGAEHAVLHLLYSRFWHKFLFDIGVVSTNEPFQTLKNQGLILAYAYEDTSGKLIASDLVEEKTSPQPSPQGEGAVSRYFNTENGEELKRVIAKMSKSLKNVVNPDEIVEKYGADSLRLYEMYIADFKDSAPWDTKNILGVRRFLEKSERLFTDEAKLSTEDDNTTMKLLHKTIKKVGEDIESYKFNTAIASLMILVNNGLPKDETLQNEWKYTFTKLLHPFAPHLAEELWERIGEKESIFLSNWPKYDEKMIIDDTVTIAIQVLGKLRGDIEIQKDEDKESVLQKAKENENIKKWIEGKEIIKEIYVPGKIVNLVVK